MATIRRSSTSSTASRGRTKAASVGQGTPRSGKKLAESPPPTEGVPKTYVLDTSVLLSDPRAMLRFSEHEVVLPVVVVTELEAKRHHQELGFFARQALQLLDEMRIQHGRLDAPIPVGQEGGTLRVELNNTDLE